MALEFYKNIRKVIPDIDVFDGDNLHILGSDKDNETKVINIVSNFLNQKKEKNLNVSRLMAEAKHINKLFPSLSVEEIRNQLEIFEDMPDRKEIVVRLIVDSKTAKVASKREFPVDGTLFDNFNNNNHSHPKIPKLSTPTTQASAGVEREHRNAVSVIKPAKFEYFKSSKPATVTSTVTSAEDLSEPGGSETSLNYSFMDAGYEIPDITEHFDLPVPKIESEVADFELPVARDMVVGFDGESASSTSLDKIFGEKRKDADNSELPYYLQGGDTGLTQYIKEEEEEAGTFNWNEITDIKPLSETSEPRAVRVRRLSDMTRPSSADGKRQFSELNEQAAPSPLSITSSDESHQKGIESYSSSFDTGDSNQTEVNYPELEVLEDNATGYYGVSVVNPTTIKITGKKKDVNEGATVGLDLTKKDDNPMRDNNVETEPLQTQNVASTSKKRNIMEQDEEMVVDGGDFNLVEYLHELTNAPPAVIKKTCNRLDLALNVKPPPDLLNFILDRIFEGDNSGGEEMDEDVINLDETPEVNNAATVQEINNATTTSVASKTEAPQAENPNTNTNTNLDMQLVNSLCSIFPEACPNYVRELCQGKTMKNEVLDELITVILNADNKYPKRRKPSPEPEVIPENQLEILQEFLPDADPDYLRMMCDKFERNPEQVKTFLNEAMEKRNYPTMKEYQRRQQLSAQQKQYTTEFSVENFIKIIPDPHAFFSDPSRNIKLDAASAHYALMFLRNKFNKLPIRVIQNAFRNNQSKLSNTIHFLKQACTQSDLVMKSVRRPVDMPKNIENIPLLQEIAYYSHEKEIKEYLSKMKEKEVAEREEAKAKGLMKTCNCCYDEEVLPRDTFSCENGCEFCKSCVLKSTEVRFGEGKLDFPCLMSCDSFFSLQTLQSVLPPKLFSKLAQKKTLEEIKSAGIAELEYCPFCDFATIPAEGYTIYTCMNPECMKESCRMCKEPSHIPLRCEEIEKDEDVRARTFVENKMTEALLRKCYKCGVKFFKEEGCNKMTCSCGAQMCYVCGQPVTSYKHFNGNGGENYDLCPLYSDTNVLNKENVLKGAQAAKAEIGVDLKYDPTVDLDKHYKERSKKYPQEHLLVGQLQNQVRNLDERRADLQNRVDVLFLRMYDILGRRRRR